MISRNALPEPRSRGFAPVVDGDVRVLVLGSLPGRASIAAGQYYAHPQNQFWRLIGAVLGQDLAGLPYEARLDRLLAHHIGLWDSIGSASRTGSLDNAIRAVSGNDLAALVSGLSGLRLIAFNGQKAARIGEQALAGAGLSIPRCTLPSSSAAHTLAFTQKADRWRDAIGPAVAAAQH